MAKAQAKREISVVERRLKSGSVFSAGSRAIPLKEPERWTIRVVNTQISDARLWEMQDEKGWGYASVADLAVAPHEVGFREQDGRLVRGTQGHEVLMKMAITDYKAIQKVKEATNRKNTFGNKAVKDTIVGAAAGQLDDGGRAAEFLDRAVQGISVKDSLERVSLED